MIMSSSLQSRRQLAGWLAASGHGSPWFGNVFFRLLAGVFGSERVLETIVPIVNRRPSVIVLITLVPERLFGRNNALSVANYNTLRPKLLEFPFHLNFLSRDRLSFCQIFLGSILSCFFMDVSGGLDESNGYVQLVILVGIILYLKMFSEN